MTDTRTKSVKMTFKALYSYVLSTNVFSFMGLLSLLVSIGALFICVIGWSQITTKQKIIFIIVGLMFTVINPLILAFKTFRQLKLSVSYKKPLNYLFSDEGIKVSQGEETLDITWEDIVRIMLTKSMIAIYTGPVNAFVIPLSQLGEDKSKIISSVVQFTAAYRPRVSRNLKVYQTGKGI